MKMAAYVLSCEERAPLRQRTLDNLEAAGWRGPVHVQVDASSAPRKQDRQCETALALLQRAVEDAPDRILFLEDDLEFNRHLEHNLACWPPSAALPPDAHFFGSLYNPTIRSAGRCDECHFFVAVPEAVYGSQAYLLSAATARAVVQRWHSVAGMQDIKISRLAADLTPLYYHVPSLVQHVGRSTWGGSDHTAADFSAEWRNGTTPPECSAGVARAHILRRVRPIEGWLAEDEAGLLVDCAWHAASLAGGRPAIVEIGSHCGKSTVLFGLALLAARCDGGRVVAIDRHDGRVTMPGARDDGDGNHVVTLQPTLQRFTEHVAAAGVAALVVPIVSAAPDVHWRGPVDLLFVDGLHDYHSAAADFACFAPSLPPRARVAFHDCAPHFPGVTRLVGEIVNSGAFTIVASAGSLVVLERQ